MSLCRFNQGGLKMNSLIKMIGLAGILSLVACDSGNSSKSASTKKQQEQNKLDISTYSLRGTDNSWPEAVEKQQSIAPNLLANNYYLIVDTSGSMNDRGCSGGKTKLAVAKKALEQFVSKLPGNANIGLLIFNKGKATEQVPLGSNTQTSIINAIKSVRKGGGGTPLGTAIRAGYISLTHQAQAQLGYGEYHLVVITDGYADTGNKPDEVVKNMLSGSAVNLHTIGFCIDENHALNLPGYTIYKSAGNPQALMDGLDSVLAEAPDFQIADFVE